MTQLQRDLYSNDDYHMSLFEVCEYLGKSSRTITRYIRRHILHPRGVKSKQGTLEYRFSKSEIEEFRRKAQDAQFYSLEDGSGLKRVPLATFASLEYREPGVAPRQQTPFIIPGISYPGQRHFDDQSVGETSVPEFQQTPAKSNDVASRNIDEGISEEKTNSPEKNINEKKPAKDHGDNEEIIELLRETTGMLRDQLKVKDDQIKNLDTKIGQLIERNRETNILLKGLQDKIVMLEKPKSAVDEQNRTEQSAEKKAAQNEVPVPAPVIDVPAEINDNSANPANTIRVKVNNGNGGYKADSIANISRDDPEGIRDNSNAVLSEAPVRKRGFFGKMFD